jgi:hypothetical protein
MDDIGGLKRDVRLEQKWRCAARQDAPVQLLVDFHRERACAVMAFRVNPDFQLFSSEAPLHEGRDKSVLRSSTERVLAGREGQAVFSWCDRDGKSPGDVPARVADQEEEVAFEIVENGVNPASIQPCDMGDVTRGNRAMLARQFADDEVADGVMIGGHEGQPLGHSLRDVFHRLQEFGIGNHTNLMAAANQELCRHIHILRWSWMFCEWITNIRLQGCTQSRRGRLARPSKEPRGFKQKAIYQEGAAALVSIGLVSTGD